MILTGDIMNRRVLTVFSLFALASLALLIRIGYINNSDSSVRADSVKYSSYLINEKRGYIYDVNMRPMVNTKTDYYIAAAPDSGSRSILKERLTSDEFLKIESNFTSGKPILLKTDREIKAGSGITAFKAYERYSDSDPAQNLIGYLDSSGNGAFGLEKIYNAFLSENSGTIKAQFPVSASGISLSGEKIRIKDDNYYSKAGIVLTIDKNIQSICENALRENKIETGCAVVLDVRDNSITALATAPSIDRSNLQKSVNDENSPFVNRALSAYSVGSVFKPIVAAAALDSGISENMTVGCDGKISVNSTVFNCHKNDGHGVLDMAGATAVSCNEYYITLGLKTGADKIIDLASSLGLGKEIKLADSLVCEGGNVPDKSEIDSAPALANLSFGQGTLMASPLQIAGVYSAFASSGIYRTPYLIKCFTDENGAVTAYYKNETQNRVITESVCKKIQSMLELTVTDGSGKNAKPEKNTAAGKTATAQSGWYENGEEVLHTWFAGYFPAENPRYAIVVMNEHGEYSSTDCAPAFKTIADGIYDIELQYAKKQ